MAKNNTNFNFRKGVVHAAVTAGLTLSMSLGMVTPAMVAFAAPEQGSVTINANSVNQGVTYNAFKIFSADVNAEGKATHIEWAPGAQTAVEAVIREADPTYAGTTAQDAAEFIAAQLNGSVVGQTILDANSFGNKLAAAVDGLTPVGTVTPGTAATFDEGYYLFVTKHDTISTNQAGTAPIFAIVNKDVAVSVTEKTTTPTVNKQVKNDQSTATAATPATPDSYVQDETGTFYHDLDSDTYSEDEPANPEMDGADPVMYRLVPGTPGTEASDGFGKVADANKDQDLDYRITGTLPSNISTYTTYHYKFTDTLPSGMSLKDGNISSVVVRVGGTDVTSQLVDTKGTISYASDVLTVDITDLKALTGVTVNADTQVTVEYKARLDADSVIGSAGNENSVVLQYTKNPNQEGDGTTDPSKTKTFTYQLELIKKDSETAVTLEGAKFTLQVAASNTDAGSVGKYVQADGSLGTTAYEFITNSSGQISIPRIDEGVYTLHETQAPNSYDLIGSDVTITLTANLDGTTQALTTFTGTVSGNEKASVTDTNTTDTKVQITLLNDKRVEIPGTGMTGRELVTVAGGTIMVISLGALLMSSKKKNNA